MGLPCRYTLKYNRSKSSQNGQQGALSAIKENLHLRDARAYLGCPQAPGAQVTQASCFLKPADGVSHALLGRVFVPE